MSFSERTTPEQRQADLEAAEFLKGTGLALSNAGELRRIATSAVKEVAARMGGE